MLTSLRMPGLSFVEKVRYHLADSFNFNPASLRLLFGHRIVEDHEVLCSLLIGDGGHGTGPIANASSRNSTCDQHNENVARTPTLRLQLVQLKEYDDGATIQLLEAVRQNDVAAMEQALQEGANPDGERGGPTPLSTAAALGSLSAVKCLCAAGAQADRAYHGSPAPVFQAAQHGACEVLRYFVEDMQVDVNSVADVGSRQTALCEAVEKDHLGIVRILCEAGVDLDKEGKDGRTPLGIAASKGNVIFVEMLLGAGAGIDVQDMDRWTALTHASVFCQYEVVNILLEAGADVVRASREGQFTIAAGPSFRGATNPRRS